MTTTRYVTATGPGKGLTTANVQEVKVPTVSANRPICPRLTESSGPLSDPEEKICEDCGGRKWSIAIEEMKVRLSAEWHVLIETTKTNARVINNLREELESLKSRGPLSDPEATNKGENNESKATDSNEVRDGLSRVGDGARTDRHSGLRDVVDVAWQVVQGAEDGPLKMALTDVLDSLDVECENCGGNRFPITEGVCQLCLDRDNEIQELRDKLAKRTKSFSDDFSRQSNNFFGPLSDGPRETENQDGAAPVLERRMSDELENEKPRLLDLFCCAGGASEGCSRAGFEVVGVDVDPQ